MKHLITSEDELAQALTEWDRRYRENPEQFMSEATHLLKGTPETYGEAAGPYLVSILEEQGARTSNVTWIDPKQDLEHYLASIEKGLPTRQDVMTGLGVDVKDIFEQLDRENI